MYVEKHTTTINGTEPVTHKGNWGYRENGGIGPTDRSWRGNSNETVRGIAFEPGTGNGLAIVLLTDSLPCQPWPARPGNPPVS